MGVVGDGVTPGGRVAVAVAVDGTGVAVGVAEGVDEGVGVRLGVGEGRKVGVLVG
jgi:hypothetical protein